MISTAAITRQAHFFLLYTYFFYNTILRNAYIKNQTIMNDVSYGSYISQPPCSFCAVTVLTAQCGPARHPPPTNLWPIFSLCFPRAWLASSGDENSTKDSPLARPLSSSGRRIPFGTISSPCNYTEKSFVNAQQKQIQLNSKCRRILPIQLILKFQVLFGKCYIFH